MLILKRINYLFLEVTHFVTLSKVLKLRNFKIDFCSIFVLISSKTPVDTLDCIRASLFRAEITILIATWLAVCTQCRCKNINVIRITEELASVRELCVWTFTGIRSILCVNPDNKLSVCQNSYKSAQPFMLHWLTNNQPLKDTNFHVYNISRINKSITKCLAIVQATRNGTLLIIYYSMFGEQCTKLKCTNLLKSFIKINIIKAVSSLRTRIVKVMDKRFIALRTMVSLCPSRGDNTYRLMREVPISDTWSH